ncbi:MAG: universal stress protein [Bacteroidota bacterium]
MIEIRTLLALTDYSEPAADALVLAEILADRHDAALHQLHVEIVPSGGSFERHADVVHRSEDGTRTERTRQAPFAGAAIVAYAAEVSADLLVMGTHGRGGWDRLVLGSTAEYVLRRSPCPVLTLGPKAKPLASGPVIASVAFGDDEENVIETAAGMAHAMGTRLIVFHAVEPLVLPAPYAVELGSIGLDRLMADATESLETRVAERVTLPLAMETAIRSGSPEPELLALIQETGASLVVQGTHRRSGLARAVLGSVAESIVRRAPVAVLTVPMGSRPLAISDRDSLTRSEPLARENWSATLDGLSLYAETAPWSVTVTVVGQDASGTILDGARLRGLSYDPHGDALDVLAEGADHRILRPLAIRVSSTGGRDPFALEVIRRDGARERIEAAPLPLPA